MISEAIQRVAPACGERACMHEWGLHNGTVGGILNLREILYLKSYHFIGGLTGGVSGRKLTLSHLFQQHCVYLRVCGSTGE